MPIGYLPDMFGHVAQMPQILRRAGIADAVVWRGVPAAIDRHAFSWSSPDGSTVRCEYLLGGYGNGHDLVTIPDRIGRRIDSFVESRRAAFGDDEVLAMYGEDHAVPLPGYAGLLEAFNESQDRFEARISTLTEYLDATRDRAIPDRPWTGELRSSARANILMGVVSHRIEVKQAAGRAERILERVAEPLLALHGDVWPERLLGLAWDRVVENSAHDSICACSAEEVVAQVLTRYAEAEQIGRGLADRALDAIGRHVAVGAFAVVNPSPVERADLVELDVPLDRSAIGAPIELPDGTSVATQDLGVSGRTLADIGLTASDVVPYLRRRLHGRELFDHRVNGFRRSVEAGGTVVTVDVDRVQDPGELDLDAFLDDLASVAATSPDADWRLRVASRPRRRLLVQVHAPALGWTAVRPAAGGVTSTADDVPAARRTERGLTNGLVDVAIADDGTFSIDGNGVSLVGVGRIVDGGDVGDSYNYAPPATDRLVEVADRVRIEEGEAGPVRASVKVIRSYAWPSGLVDDLSARTAETVATDVRVTIDLRVGEPFVRITVAFENRAVDHRLRFHVPLPASADRSFAEGQFAVVERGTVMEGGHGERPLPTFPAHGMVSADGVAILLGHVLEYELVDGPELALTVLRATGFISRDPHPYRDEPAGPAIAAPTGQGLGERSVSFAVMPTPAGRPSAAVLAVLERYRNPFLVATGAGAPDLALHSATGLEIHGDGVVLSSLRRRGPAIEARLVNEQATATRVTVRGAFTSVTEVDLLGRATGASQPAAGSTDFELGPWEIRTLSLT
jgi:alpha-mannosidase